MTLSNSPQLLISRAREGSIEALNTLLDAYKQHIYAIAYALLNDRSDAIEAMRESLTAVWKNIGLLGDDEDFEVWLYHIAYTISEQVRVSKGRPASARTDKLARTAETDRLLLPPQYAAQSALRERLTQIVFSLPDQQRETVVLYYYHNKSVADVAAIMDCSERKAQSRLYQAHSAVRAAVIAQEEQHGEHYFGTVTPSVSLGDFIARHIDRNLPTQQEIGDILESSRSAAYFSTNTYTAKLSKKQKNKRHKKPKKSRPAAAPRHSAPARQTAAPPKPAQDAPAPTAARTRDYSPAIKIFVIAMIVALLACLGVLAYTTLLRSDSTQATADEADHALVTATEAALPGTDAPAPSPTEAPTQSPTEAPTTAPATTAPDYSAAYSAYRSLLEDKHDVIWDYSWQYRVDPSHPVAFADVMGDDTPEMIYACATDIGDGGDKYLTLHVITFDGTNAVDAYRIDLSDNTRRSGGIYCVTQIEGEKSLYTFAVSSPGVLRTETACRYVDNGNNTLTQEEVVVYNPRTDLTDEEKVNGKTVSAEKAKSAYYELAAKSKTLLLSSSDSRGVGYPTILDIDADNEALTYGEALDYLDSHI